MFCEPFYVHVRVDSHLTSWNKDDLNSETSFYHPCTPYHAKFEIIHESMCMAEIQTVTLDKC